jgi:hypothetical protein
MSTTCATCGGPLELNGSWCVPCGLPVHPFRMETLVPLLQIHRRIDQEIRNLGVIGEHDAIETFADTLPVSGLPAEATFRVRYAIPKERIMAEHIYLIRLCFPKERVEEGLARQAELETLVQTRRQILERLREEPANLQELIDSLQNIQCAIVRKEVELRAISLG